MHMYIIHMQAAGLGQSGLIAGQPGIKQCQSGIKQGQFETEAT